MRFSQVSKCVEKQNGLSCHSQNDNPAKLVIVFANTILANFLQTYKILVPEAPHALRV